MKLEHLAAHGFSPRLVEAWLRTRDAELLPLQAHAVSRTGLLQGRSLAVFAPTSAGKTFVGELAALRHIERGGRAVFLVPTKALAEELMGHFSVTYGPLALRICLSTSEHRGHDGDLTAGQFDLGILVYEKLRTLLVACPELAGLVTCVVADELQILGDAERGALVDLILTKFKTSPHPPQIIGMSAVVDDHERLAAWLGAELLVWHERPVELREGVFDSEKGVFHYRECNSRREGDEMLCTPTALEALSANDAAFRRSHIDVTVVASVAALARELAERRGEQLLIFVPTKGLSRQLAEKLAGLLELTPPSPACLEALAFADESLQTELLGRVMKRGVVFHNADLPLQLRQQVERAFDAGEIRVLVATSTLAQGVNLTCQNVVSLPTMVVQGEIASQPVMVPLSRARLRNQGGRAGRFRRTTFGRSIVVARNSAEADRLFELLFRGQAEPVAPRLTPEALAGAMLGFVVSRRNGPSPVEPASAVEFLGNMFGAKTMDSATLRTSVEGTLGWLASYELIVRNHSGFAATACGEVAAAFGLDPVTTSLLREAAELFETNPPDEEFPILLAAACTPVAVAFPVNAAPWEIRSGKYLHLYHDYLCQTRAGGYEQEILRLPGGGASARDHSALKKAFLAQAWIGVRPTRAIEQAFGVLAGSISDLTHQLAWLVEALGALAARLGKNSKIHADCNILAERLRYGATELALPLAKALRGVVARTHLQALVQEGFDSVSALEEAEDTALERLVPPPVVKAIREHLAGPRTSAAVTGGTDREGSRHQHNRLPRRQTPSLSVCAVGAMKTSATVEPDGHPDGDGERSPKGYAGTSGEQEGALTASEKNMRCGAQPYVEIDTKSPGVVRVNSERVFLSVLPYKLLLYLAKHPQRVIPYAEIDQALWPDSKVEQQQILAHKATLVKRFGEVLGSAKARSVLRTIPGHGLCLDLQPSCINIVEEH